MTTTADGLHLVAGMHRSGTSVVARMINELGGNLGPEDDLLPPKPDNPDGFWESASFVAINDDLLAAMGGLWEAPPSVADQISHVDSELGERARELVASRTAKTGSWVAKDPRVSLLLPFWRRIEPTGRTFVCIRDPLSSAASLNRRNGMDLDAGVGLWFRYTMTVLANAASPHVVILEDLLERPENAVAGIVAALSMEDVSTETVLAVSELVDDSKVMEVDATGQFPDEASVYEALRSLDQHSMAWIAMADSILDQAAGAEVELDRSNNREQVMLGERDDAREALAAASAREQSLLENRDAVLDERDDAREALAAAGAREQLLLENRDAVLDERDSAREAFGASTEREFQMRRRAADLEAKLEAASAQLDWYENAGLVDRIRRSTPPGREEVDR